MSDCNQAYCPVSEAECTGLRAKCTELDPQCTEPGRQCIELAREEAARLRQELADAREAVQVLGLKLAQAEGEIKHLRAERASVPVPQPTGRGVRLLQARGGAVVSEQVVILPSARTSDPTLLTVLREARDAGLDTLEFRVVRYLYCDHGAAIARKYIERHRREASS